MQGEDFTFPEMLRYRAIAESLIEDIEDLRLREQDFVFFTHQGYQFLFFETGGPDDPAVYHYNDDEPRFRKLFDSFTEWLDVCMKEEIELRSGQAP